jgi:hypothetical protein
MTDSKLKKKQERAQAAAFDMFNTMARHGVWRCHLAIGAHPGEQAPSGEFEGLTLAGAGEAAIDSDLTEVIVTFARPPERKAEKAVAPPKEETTEEVKDSV